MSNQPLIHGESNEVQRAGAPSQQARSVKAEFSEHDLDVWELDDYATHKQYAESNHQVGHGRGAWLDFFVFCFALSFITFFSARQVY